MSQDTFGTRRTGTVQTGTGAAGAGSDAAGRSPDRAEVLAVLAALGGREPSAVGEELGSLELAWLVAETEQRHGVVLDLSEADLDRMATVDGAVLVLGEALAGTGVPRP